MTNDLQAFLARARAAVAIAPSAFEARDASPAFAQPQLAGRLVELSASGAGATMTAAIELVRGAQAASEPVAWIASPGASFYPPDAADSGVDLDALVIVRVTDAIAAARAAERLLRSGAFGLIAIDLGAGDVPIAHQGRLVTLAQQHDAAVVFLTEKAAGAASLGSLISLRVEALRRCDGADRYACVLRAIKDKRRGPGWSDERIVRAPDGAGTP